MAKEKTIFFCRECGYESPKWLGKCPSCNKWNTFTEEVLRKSSTKTSVAKRSEDLKIKTLDEISITDYVRIDTGISELNRVLGGGIVPGAVVLLGGEPGIGKSTLALQFALSIKKKIIYISGEESEQQIKFRANRLKEKNNNLFIYSGTSLEDIETIFKNEKPDIAIIDSIQTIKTELLDSPAGTITQIRESASKLQEIAKTLNINIILIGHITKDGSIAGPKILEHIVDTVLQFEGDRNYFFRMLRVNKNRYGATSELGIFEMREDGLKEVLNPSEVLINKNHPDLSGSAIGATIDGMRPFLVEIQALVSTAAYGTPQRSTTGFDTRRLNMLLAVLEKRAGFKLSIKDVFLNIAGGIKLTDPGIDLAVISAILSSYLDIPIDNSVCFAAEIGLSGEIRSISRIEQRIKEAEKLGFSKIFLPAHLQKNMKTPNGSIKFEFVENVGELVKKLFANKN